jgi:glucan biosynthesis protein C
VRFIQLQPSTPGYLLAIESNLWIISVLAFGYRYLNRPGAALKYLSEAAYPIYILHMTFLYLGSSLIFALDMAAPVQFMLLLLFTIAGCFVCYELIIRRVNFIRPWFGLKARTQSAEASSHVCIKSNMMNLDKNTSS